MLKDAPLTVSARANPGAWIEFLWAYGTAYGRAERDVYLRCIIGNEPWFIKGGTGVWSELVQQGWTQREADSIRRSASARQAAALESTKLHLDRAREQLKETRQKLRRAMKNDKKKRTRHGLSRRVAILRSRIQRLERLVHHDQVRVCFGGRRALRATREWKASGYSSQEEAHAMWERRRAGNIYVIGSRSDTQGNSSLRIHLSEDGARDYVRMRVPLFLQHLTNNQPWVEISVQGFPEAWGRAALQQSVSVDTVSNEQRRAEKARLYSQYQERLARIASGEYGPEPKKVTKKPPRNHSSGPVTVQFSWNEEKSSWYIQATLEPLKKATTGPWKAVMGIDINPDHLAWGLIDTKGNPITKYSGRIELDLTGPKGSIETNIGNAIHELTNINLGFQEQYEGDIPIIHERLDFQNSRAQLRYTSKRLARLLSSFAYHRIIEILTSRAKRDGILTRGVHPAWTSVLGQANYASPYGLSVDQAASVVIARRGLGLRTRIRPGLHVRLRSSTATIPACDGNGGGGQPSSMHVQLSLGQLARHLGKRSATWGSPGLARGSSPPASAVEASVETVSMSGKRKPHEGNVGAASQDETMIPRPLPG